LDTRRRRTPPDTPRTASHCRGRATHAADLGCRSRRMPRPGWRWSSSLLPRFLLGDTSVARWASAWVLRPARPDRWPHWNPAWSAGVAAPSAPAAISIPAPSGLARRLRPARARAGHFRLGRPPRLPSSAVRRSPGKTKEARDEGLATDFSSVGNSMMRRSLTTASLADCLPHPTLGRPARAVNPKFPWVSRSGAAESAVARSPPDGGKSVDFRGPAPRAPAVSGQEHPTHPSLHQRSRVGRAGRDVASQAALRYSGPRAQAVANAGRSESARRPAASTDSGHDGAVAPPETGLDGVVGDGKASTRF